MVPGRIAGRIRFRFHDAAAQPPRRKIMDDDLSNKKAGELDSVRRKCGAAKRAKREFL